VDQVAESRKWLDDGDTNYDVFLRHPSRPDLPRPKFFIHCVAGAPLGNSIKVRLMYEAIHQFPSNVNNENEWSFISSPPTPYNSVFKLSAQRTSRPPSHISPHPNVYASK
jgi:hypothetical protein